MKKILQKIEKINFSCPYCDYPFEPKSSQVEKVSRELEGHILLECPECEEIIKIERIETYQVGETQDYCRDCMKEFQYDKTMCFYYCPKCKKKQCPVCEELTDSYDGYCSIQCLNSTCI